MILQIICDPQFVAESAQKSFECLKSARDVISRTGHSVALGCLHRYVGGMGSTQYLQTSVSILMALAQDTASPQVQIWALHSLTTIGTYVELHSSTKNRSNLRVNDLEQTKAPTFLLC